MSRNNQPQRRNNNNGKNSNGRRRSRGNRAKPVDIWKAAGPLPEVEPIVVADDPTALVRSLGTPPPLGGKDISYYFETVVGQSAQIAMALALSVDLLATND